MVVNKIKDIILSILYELQPIRYSDAIKLSHYIIHNSIQIIQAIYQFIVWILSQLQALSIQWIAMVVVWFLGWYGVHLVGFASLYFMVSIIVGMFWNLGKRRKGELSAYSVFNDKFQTLLGTLTADQLDQQLRHSLNHGDDDQWNDNNDNRNNRENQQRPNLEHRVLKGKKSRRGYEKKLLKRQQQQNREGRRDEGDDDDNAELLIDDDD